MDRLWKDAEEDVRAFWDHIAAVANALLAKQTLSEEEVVAIMSEVPENPDPFEELTHRPPFGAVSLCPVSAPPLRE